MSDKIFIDTNIFVYGALDDNKNEIKRTKVIKLLKNTKYEVVISTQVINEFYVTLLRNNISEDSIISKIEEIIKNTEITIITLDTIKQAWKIRKNYNISYWDSLIVSAALESKSKLIFSEDMQDNMSIWNSLKIKNPFI